PAERIGVRVKSVASKPGSDDDVNVLDICRMAAYDRAAEWAIRRSAGTLTRVRIQTSRHAKSDRGKSMAFDAVNYEKDDHVVTITLNRPEALNAVNQQLRDDLDAAWEAFKADADAWVAILTGAGDRALCAGLDVKEEARTGNMSRPREEMPRQN